MKSWRILFNNCKNDVAFKSLPNLIQDCVRFYFCYDEVREVDHPYPILAECHMRYTTVDVVNAYTWLLNNDIHSLIIAESSTYLLDLLRTLFDAAEQCNLSISVSKNYNHEYKNKWGDVKAVRGIILNIRRSRSVKNK